MSGAAGKELKQFHDAIFSFQSKLSMWLVARPRVAAFSPEHKGIAVARSRVEDASPPRPKKCVRSSSLFNRMNNNTSI
jgi:hypothetical protein